MAVIFRPGEGFVSVPDSQAKQEMTKMIIARRSAPKTSVRVSTPSVSVKPSGSGAEVVINGVGYSVAGGNVEEFLRSRGISGGQISQAKQIDEYARTQEMIKQAKEQQQREAILESQRKIEATKRQLIAQGGKSIKVFTRDSAGNILKESEQISRGATRINFVRDYRTGESTIEEYRGGALYSGVQTKGQTPAQSKKIQSELRALGLTPIVTNGQVVGFRDSETQKTYSYDEKGMKQYNVDVQSSKVSFLKQIKEMKEGAQSTIRRKGKLEMKGLSALQRTKTGREVLKWGGRTLELTDKVRNGLINSRIFKVGDSVAKVEEKLGTHLINTGNRAMRIADQVKAPKVMDTLLGERFSKRTINQVQFLIGAGAEITKITGGFLQFPAVTMAILKNPILALGLGGGILAGVKSDLIRIKNIPSGSASSAGAGTIIALSYLTPVTSKGARIVNKFRLRNMARVSAKDINKLKYVAGKRLATIEKTTRQRGAITQIAGKGVAKTKTGSISRIQYEGLMRVGKRDATILQTSSAKLKNGVRYGSISQVNMRFGQKMLPVPQRIGGGYVFVKVQNKLLKLPFSKIKYSSREIISWLVDSKGRVTANIFGKQKYFKNLQKFKSYVSSAHGIKVLRGLYGNPRIRNMPVTRGTTFAFQRKIFEKDKMGARINIYRTGRGSVRKRIFRAGSEGKAIEIIKPTKIKKVKYGKRFSLPPEKRTPFSRTFGSQQTTQQTSISKLVPPTRIIPAVARKSLNKLISKSRAVKTIQKSLVRGATIGVIGSSLVARLSSGRLISIREASRLNERQLNQQMSQIRQEIKPITRQASPQQIRQTSQQQNSQLVNQQNRQLVNQQGRQLTRQLTRQQTRQLTRQQTRTIPGMPKIRIPKSPKRPPFIPSIIPSSNFKPVTLPVAVQTYYVIEKRMGKFRKLYPKPLTAKDAKDYAVYSIDNKLSRTAFFIPMGKSKNVVRPPKQIQGYAIRNSFKVRPYKIRMGKRRQLVNGYIEKRKYFADTSGERGALRATRRISPLRRRQLIAQLKRARMIRMRRMRRRR